MDCTPRTLVAALGLLLTPLAACAQAEAHTEPAPASAPLHTAAAMHAVPPEPPRVASAEDRARFDEAARAAWSFIDRNYRPETGLVRAHDSYQYVTTWDIASGLAALFAARELELIDAAEYDRRMSRALATLARMPLYDGAAFNKSYAAETARMVGRDDRTSTRGYGWSATDLGRLLVWLKVVAENHPQHAAAAAAVVERLDFSRLVRDGYLQGEDLDPRDGRVRRYQEGRIGYEQYAAAGFRAWGHAAPRALSLRENTAPAEVLGVAVLRDRRGGDRLTSEPFVLMGLELGWTSPEWKALAAGVLAAQRARYEQTGQVTVVSEDALPDAPHYFYYYTVLHDGEPFAVDVQGTLRGTAPRWVSTKAAFGWHALLPDDYTSRALDTVAPARSRMGWSSGVYERSGRSTGVYSVNTAAVVLEAALYAKRGRPLVQPR